MPVDFEAVIQTLLELVHPCAAERIPLAASWGRVLAEDIEAQMDYPPFDRSLWDGYAVLNSDVAAASQQNPVMLRQIDYVPAGSVSSCCVGSGQAVRIMTGAALPCGADTVVRLEDTVQDGLKNIYVLASGMDRKSISRRGEEIHKGELVVQQGMPVNAGAMGVLATLGRSDLLVYGCPRVGVLGTGSEIVDVADKLMPGKIHNSNSYMLCGWIKEAGGYPVLAGMVEDATEKIVTALAGMAQCDIIITTGGVSAGDYDLMEQVFRRLGISILFDQLAIKTAMPLLAGKWRDKLVLALSGTPSAAAVVFEILVHPLLRKMAGDKIMRRPQVQAVLTGACPRDQEFRRFMWAQCRWQGQRWEAMPLYRKNGMLKTLMHANALVDVPPGDTPLAAGETTTVMLMNPAYSSGL